MEIEQFVRAKAKEFYNLSSLHSGVPCVPVGPAGIDDSAAIPLLASLPYSCLVITLIWEELKSRLCISVQSTSGKIKLNVLSASDVMKIPVVSKTVNLQAAPIDSLDGRRT